MEKEAVEVFYKELRRKLREIDWLNTPYLQMMMDDNDQWLIYQKELESISMKIEKKELVPPKIEKGNLIFNWPMRYFCTQSFSQSSHNNLRNIYVKST